MYMCLSGANALTLIVWDAQPLLSVWKVGRNVSERPRRRDLRVGSTHRQLVGLADVLRPLATEPVEGDGVSADDGFHRADDGFTVGVPAGRSRSPEGAEPGQDQRERGWGARHSLPTDAEGCLPVQNGDHAGQLHIHFILGQHWSRRKRVEHPSEAGSRILNPPYSLSSKSCWILSPLSVVAPMV